VFADLLLRAFPDLSVEQIARLEEHYNLLQLWNRSLNLTSIRRLEEIVERHYCESLFVGQVLEPVPQSIADVGSGAGFPGFPLAVLRPDCRVTLIESHQRKAVFLKEAARKVSNVRVLATRAEDVALGFDWVVSRAVSYVGLSSFLPRFASKVALLTGEELPAGLGYVWEPPIPLPWGKNRFLRVGRFT